MFCDGPAPRVALVGAGGFGLVHRREMRPLHEAGHIRLVAMADLQPITPAAGAPLPAGVSLHADHREMLATVRPDVAIVATPPHTHLPIAVEALEAGCDVLLEKPPVVSTAEHHALAGAVLRTGRACQVGFQSLGSAALASLLAAVSAGALGDVVGVSIAGTMRRDDAYYTRAAWAGRRTLGGRPVLDGALVNPFAHGLMLGLAVAGAAAAGAPRLLEAERYRARDIEVDDTTSARVTFASGLRLVAAVTLCGEGGGFGEVTVHGTAGRAFFDYASDRLRLPGDAAPREVAGRVGLLENLIAHRATGADLVAALTRTAPFTALAEAVAAGEPTPVPPDQVVAAGEGDRRVRVVRHVDAAVREAAGRLATFSEIGVPWATAPHRVGLDGGRG